MERPALPPSFKDDPAPHPGFTRGLFHTANIACLLSGAIGLLNLMGWAFHIMALRDMLSPIGLDNAMAASTALLFMFSATSLWLGINHSSLGHQQIAIILGIVTAVVGGIKIVQYQLHLPTLLDPHLNHLLGWPPGINMMAQQTAFGFLLNGIALFTFNLKHPRLTTISQAFALCGAFIAYVSSLGHIFRVPTLLGSPIPPFQIGPPATIAFVFLSIGLVLVLSSRGWMRIFSEQGTAGVTARRLLPFIFFLPIALGWSGIALLDEGILEIRGLMLWITVGSEVLLGYVLVGTVRKIHKLEILQNQHTNAIKENEVRLRKILEASRDPILCLDTSREVLFASPSIKDVLGIDAQSFNTTALHTCIYPESIPVWLALWQHFKQHSRFPESPFQMVWVRKDSSLFLADHTISNIYDAHGLVEGVQIVIRPHGQGNGT